MSKENSATVAYWLFKTEPSSYSIDDLKQDKKTFWDGIRNYQVRNLLRDRIKMGDRVLVYHSSTEVIGVVGEMIVASAAHADPTQFDANDKHFDPKASLDNPRWLGVEVRYIRTFPKVVTLAALRAEPALANMVVLQKGSRLSVTPLTRSEFEAVVKLAAEC